MVKGILVGGNFSDLIIRQKENSYFEMGELLIAEDAKQKMLLQVFDIEFASQMSEQHLELVGGLQLEDKQAIFHDASLRNYTLAHIKPMLAIRDGRLLKAKGLPIFFSTVRALRPEDFSFLQKPENPLFLGKMRNGSETIDVPLYINGKDALSHHVLIAATTGRGKSNLLKCLLSELSNERYCGMLVLDPHDEYYRNVLDSRQSVHQYSTNPTPGGNTLRFNLALLKPQHFQGTVDWSDPQRQALAHYYKEYREEWVEAIMLDKKLRVDFNEGTIAVIRRRMMQVLGLDVSEGNIISDGVFTTSGGTTTITDICNTLEKGEMVIVDTSCFDGATEILVGSIIASELLRRYKQAKLHGTLNDKPVISIIIEEAPRVLGKEVLEQGPNVFSTIAREGRKFKIGIMAITQLPSLIPRDILANMNTKIILGLEMKAERQAMIESASQDLSTDDRAIASLDKGEAIVTSTFVPFALPIRIPLFDTFVSQSSLQKPKSSFNGIKRG